jgi:hypothetical protein
MTRARDAERQRGFRAAAGETREVSAALEGLAETRPPKRRARNSRFCAALGQRHSRPLGGAVKPPRPRLPAGGEDGSPGGTEGEGLALRGGVRRSQTGRIAKPGALWLTAALAAFGASRAGTIRAPEAPIRGRPRIRTLGFIVENPYRGSFDRRTHSTEQAAVRRRVLCKTLA